jgi:hypothetical protein
MLPQSSQVAANFIEHLQATRFLDQYYKQRVVPLPAPDAEQIVPADRAERSPDSAKKAPAVETIVAMQCSQ